MGWLTIGTVATCGFVALLWLGRWKGQGEVGIHHRWGALSTENGKAEPMSRLGTLGSRQLETR